MISHVDIIGALVYRTRKALNESLEVYKRVQKAKYPYPDVLFDSKNPQNMHLWHFAGTNSEIQRTFETLGKDVKSAKLVFPAILNYQSVIETHGVGSDGLTQFDFDLVIIAPVHTSWTTEQRNRLTHDCVLEPIYDEFMRQLYKCGWFQIPLQGLDYVRAKVFTSGTSEHRVIRNQLGWYADYIEITDLRPLLKKNICDDVINQIKAEAEKVTENLNDL